MDADFAMRDGENNAKALFRQGQVSMIVHQVNLRLLPYADINL